MNKITKLRLKKRKSKNQMAIDLGVDRREIILWENGQRNPNVENSFKLANYFNVSPLEFLNEIELTDNPDIAQERLRYYSEELSIIFSQKMKTEDKILNAKLVSKSVQKIDLRKFAKVALVLLPLLILYSDNYNEIRFGNSVVIEMEITKIFCSVDSCVFEVVDVLRGDYQHSFIELPNELSGEHYIVLVYETDGKYNIYSYEDL